MSAMEAPFASPDASGRLPARLPGRQFWPPAAAAVEEAAVGGCRDGGTGIGVGGTVEAVAEAAVEAAARR